MEKLDPLRNFEPQGLGKKGNREGREGIKRWKDRGWRRMRIEKCKIRNYNKGVERNTLLNN